MTKSNVATLKHEAPQTLFKVTPKQFVRDATKVLKAGRVPYILSSPGMGKSSLAKQIAKKFNLKFIDIRLAQCTPEDLNGFPMRVGNKATFVPFDQFPIVGDEVPEGYDGWLILFDELSSAGKSVQAAAYRPILDREVGSHKLHPKCAVMAAGNLMTDKAVVTAMSTALQSRVIHFEMELSLADFTEYAIEAGIDPRVIAYLQYMPNRLMDFNPDHTDKTFPCPRTWEFLSDIIKGEDVTQEDSALLAGTVGTGDAVSFISFVEEFHLLPKFSEIVAKPKNAPIPDKESTKWAAMAMLMEKTDINSIDQVLDYVDRFSTEFQIIFFRGVAARDAKLREKSPKFAAALLKMVRFIR